MKSFILFFSIISLISLTFSTSIGASMLPRGDNAQISVEQNCIRLWNGQTLGKYQLCCNEDFPKEITLPYFDLRSGFEKLKSDFDEFTRSKRGCHWEHQRQYY